MSILIKGMEMPTSCHECRMYEADTYYCSTADRVIDIPDSSEERCAFCPLVPVPPHGRLIDKDVMCNECRRIAEEYDGIYPDCTYCPAHLAPTIIPAEEDK